MTEQDRIADEPCCGRCGRGMYSEEERERLREDPGYLPTSSLSWVKLPEGGWSCWECLTVVEQRNENRQCARCGAEFYDLETDTEAAGWITDHFEDPHAEQYLCPDCQTDAEARAHAQAFVDSVERGQRLKAEKGERYPADLAALGENQRWWLERRKDETADLEQALGEDDGDDG